MVQFGQPSVHAVNVTAGIRTMRIAYLTSRYPAISHTFILREVLALRERGVEVRTFSIHRALPSDIIGDEAKQEAADTISLLPIRPIRWLLALIWCGLTRPIRMLRVLIRATARSKLSIRQRLKGIAYFGEAVVLAHRLASDRLEHLHCHFGNNGSTTGMLAAQLARVPFSVTAHGSELLDPRYHRIREKVKAAVFVACVSRFGRAQIMAECDPQQWSKLHLVRCGLPPSDMRDVNPPVSKSGSGHHEPLKLLCVGRLSREKGHLVLLEALHQLKKSQVDFTCTLIGDGPLRQQISQRRSELHLTQELCLAGAMEPRQVGLAYEQADMLILPSFSEGVPVVAMEAMARARPVIATFVGGVPELIEHDVTGWLVPPGDPSALAGAVQYLWSHPAIAQRLGAAGQLQVQHEFNLLKSVDLLTNLFRSARSGSHDQKVGTAGSTTWPFMTSTSS